MKPLILLLAIILCAAQAMPQNQQKGLIKGRVTDIEEGSPLRGATVKLLYKKDSTLAASCITGEDGAFLLPDLQNGYYLLLVTYLGFQSYASPVLITEMLNLVNVGNIIMKRSGLTLGVIEILKVRTPITIKNDTIEFTADTYKIRENAVVGDLLKRIPGLRIGKDGNITAMGQTVKQVLINGKPYMGGNIRLALENLPAEIVDKIQLTDFRTEQEKSLGTKGSEPGKAINITIRQKSEGPFLGSAQASAGTDGRFIAKSSLNRFQKGQQLGLVLGGNNVNNLNFADVVSERTDAGGPTAGGAGITREWNAALHYDENLTAKLKVNASYELKNDRTEVLRDIARQNLLPDTSYYYNQHEQSVTRSSTHNMTVRLDYTIDSMHALMVSSNIGHRKNGSSQYNQYETLNGQRERVNAGHTTNTGSGATPSFSTELLFMKKFSKPRRSFTSFLTYQSSASWLENFNQSGNQFQSPNGGIYTDSINQQSQIASRTRKINWSLSGSEPLSDYRSLDLNYFLDYEKGSSEKETYNFNAEKGIFDLPDDSLSDYFRYTLITHGTSIILRTKKGRYEYKIGACLQSNRLVNYGLNDNTSITQNTFNIMPVAIFSYAFSENSLLEFYYGANTQLPNSSQLQPVPDNSNPLYVRMGNPDLKPSISKILTLSYKGVNNKNKHGLFVTLGFDLASNKIIYASWFDSLGRQVSRLQNVSGAYTCNGEMTYSYPLSMNTMLNMTSSFDIARDVTYTNWVKGEVRNVLLSQLINLNYKYKELGDVALSARINVATINYTVQRENNMKFANFLLSCDGSVNLPAGVTAGLNIQYVCSTGRADGYNQDVIMLNASLYKYLFRNRRGLIKLQGFDLLKQNTSIIRNVDENYIDDVRSNTLQRFLMLGFSYFLK